MKEVKQHFRPEFLNRIDETVVFHALGAGHILSIARIQLRALEERLAAQDMKLEVSEAALQELAKVGFERLEEIENPELAARRMREIYQQKGYSEEWIEKRMRGIAVRDELTDEWKKRGVKESKEFAILTAEISKATFGMTLAEYKEFKDLSNPKENLRDHMTDLELIFTMLGEASTTEIAKKRDAQGFPANQKASKAGGTIAGNARRALEIESGTKISTRRNFKALPESQAKKLPKHSQP